MAFIIDRRLNAKNKSAVNRQRFLHRYRKHIKDAISDAVSQRSITDMEKGEEISIPKKDIKEPVFSHGHGGRRDIILPGNKEFIAGDTIPRPSGGTGGGSGSGASDSGEGDDDFVFSINREEFLEFMFEDLELPNLLKRQLAGTDTFTYRRAGFSNVGNPNQINIIRSLRSANARRIALTSPAKRRLKEAREALQRLETSTAANHDQEIKALHLEIEELEKRIKRIPFLDTFDLKYNLHTRHPEPSAKAVMFCIMDVSGSMNQATKDMAKRFFILLYLFLQRNYDHTEVVFIRHHTSAKEVDEETFFYSRETGGTIVSSALKLTKEIIADRYPTSEWNIYGAQASDGDNWDDDSSNCYSLLINDLMPQLQYYAYIEITQGRQQQLWHEYELVKEQFQDSFAMKHITQQSDIYPVFHELFQRKEA